MALTKSANRMISGADINVKDLGAVGNGAADDTAAIQASIVSTYGNEVSYFLNMP